MAAVPFLIRRPWDEQPQEAVHIDPRWIDEGLAAAITRVAGGNGPLRDVLWQAIPDVDSSTHGVNAQGAVADFTSGQYTRFPDRPEYRVTGALTVICGLYVRSFTNYTHMVSKNGTGVTDNSPIEFRHNSLTGSQLTVVRASGSNFSIWDSTGATSSTGYQVNAFSMPSGDLAALPRMWQNGVELSVSASVSGSGFVTDNGQPLYVAVRQDNVTQLDGQLLFAWIFSRALTVGQIQELTWQPWRLFAKRMILVRKPAASTFSPSWARGSNSLICPGVFA